jgi:hypothetical protein
MALLRGLTTNVAVGQATSVLHLGSHLQEVRAGSLGQRSKALELKELLSPPQHQSSTFS